MKLTTPYYDTNPPKVFGHDYNDPAIEADGTTGACLAVGEELVRRSVEKGIQNQFGAYIIYASSKQNAFGYDLFVNTSSVHAAPIFKSLMDQVTYRFFASQTDTSLGIDPNDMTLVVKNHLLVYTKTTKATPGSSLALVACLFLVIVFSYYPVVVIVVIVKEKESGHNSMHQQLVSGVGRTVFWLANYLWDLLM